MYGGDDTHRRHVHARPDDALGDQARDGCVRVQGREGHAAGVLRHRRRGLQEGLRLYVERGTLAGPRTSRRTDDSTGSLSRVPGVVRRGDASRQLTVDGFFRGCSVRPARCRLRASSSASPGASTSPTASPTRSPPTWRSRSRSAWDLPFWPSAILGVLSPRSSGVAIERVVYRPLARNAGADRAAWRSSSPRSASASPARTSSGCSGARRRRPTSARRRRPYHVWDTVVPQLRRVAGAQRIALVLDPAPLMLRYTRSAARSRPPASTPSWPRIIGINAEHDLPDLLRHRLDLRRRGRLLVRPASTRSTRHGLQARDLRLRRRLPGRHGAARRSGCSSPASWWR